MNRAPTTTRMRSFRMYIQHNVFFIVYVTPIAAAAVATVMFGTGVTKPGDSDIAAVLMGFALCAFLGPAMGLIFLRQRGPLRIDPETATLTYRRHVYPFDTLGLVRVGELETLLPSLSSVESGAPGDASTVMVGVVGSGDFLLSPDDQLPRRRVEKLANALNDALADYWQRKGEPLAPMGHTERPGR